jgi:hypothetical protein
MDQDILRRGSAGQWLKRIADILSSPVEAVELPLGKRWIVYAVIFLRVSLPRE